MLDTAKKAISKWRTDGTLATFRSARHLLRTQLTDWYVSARLGETTTIRDINLELGNAPIGSEMAKRLYDAQYEAEEIEAIETSFSPRMDVIELGACIGFTACSFTGHIPRRTKRWRLAPWCPLGAQVRTDPVKNLLLSTQ